MSNCCSWTFAYGNQDETLGRFYLKHKGRDTITDYVGGQMSKARLAWFEWLLLGAVIALMFQIWPAQFWSFALALDVTRWPLWLGLTVNAVVLAGLLLYRFRAR